MAWSAGVQRNKAGRVKNEIGLYSRGVALAGELSFVLKRLGCACTPGLPCRYCYSLEQLIERLKSDLEGLEMLANEDAEPE